MCTGALRANGQEPERHDAVSEWGSVYRCTMRPHQQRPHGRSVAALHRHVQRRAPVLIFEVHVVAPSRHHQHRGGFARGRRLCLGFRV